MGKIRGAMAEISTEFQVLPPAVYTLKIDKVSEVKGKKGTDQENDVVGYRVNTKVEDPGDFNGKTCSEYIHIASAESDDPNEIGLAQLKRYFEGAFGKPALKKWKDEDYDTDKLIGRVFRGQVAIESYTPKGASEPRQSNRIKAFEKI